MTTILFQQDNKFFPYIYKSEQELEDLIVTQANRVFGEKNVYIDLKKKLVSSKGIAGIPDGFVLDLSKGKLFIIEIELSAHDIIRHISNQLVRFKVAMNNPEARLELAQAIFEKNNKTEFDKIKRILNNNFGIAIIIDDVTEQLLELVEVLSKDGTEVVTIPFETYSDSQNNKIYKFTTFTKEALEQEAKRWTFKWSDVPVEKHLDKVNSDVRELFTKLSKEILELHGVKQKSRKNWVTFQTSPLKNFCTVKLLSDSLEINLKCDNNFIDKDQLCRNIKRTPAWTFDKVFNISSEEQIEPAMFLIHQSFECICR